MTLKGQARSTRSDPNLVTSMWTEGGSTIVAISGDADLAALPFLVDMLAGVVAGGGNDVVVDLADAAFIDPASIRVIAIAAKRLAFMGRALTFRSPSEAAVELLATFGLAGQVEPERTAAPSRH